MAETDIVNIHRDMGDMKKDVGEVRANIVNITAVLAEVKVILSEMTKDNSGIKSAIDQLTQAGHEFRANISGQGTRITHVEGRLTAVENRPMYSKASIIDQVWKWVIAGVGAVVAFEIAGFFKGT